MVAVHLPPLDKDPYLSSSLLWPRPQDGAGSIHSIVLSDWWTSKPILLGNYFSHVKAPLGEALLSFIYKPPSHPLNHPREKSPEQEVSFHQQQHQSRWDVRYLPTFAVSTYPGTTGAMPCQKMTEVSPPTQLLWHQWCYKASMFACVEKMGKISNDPLEVRLGLLLFPYLFLPVKAVTIKKRKAILFQDFRQETLASW